MPVLGFEGIKSAGKTLAMVYYANQEVQDLGKKLIFANFHLKGIPFHFLNFSRFVPGSNSRKPEPATLIPCEHEDCQGLAEPVFHVLLDMAKANYDFNCAVILIDEAHIWFDSRLSQTSTNRLFSYLLLQTSKDDINLYYTTQDFGQVDKRVRLNTDIAVHVSKVDVRHNTTNHWHKLVIIDRRMEVPRPMTKALWGPSAWNLYDTREVVRV